MMISRRRLLAAGVTGAGGLVLSGCDRLAESPAMQPLLDFGQMLSYRAHRLLLARQPLVREYSLADMSPDFPVNGTAMPNGFSYSEMMSSRFAGWRLKLDGVVRRQLSLSLEELRRLPARTQVTQHSCDEGWSAIGQWTGVPLGHVLNLAGLAPETRYIVFHCLDEMTAGVFYYESIDLFDAFHPQTILAYAMNGRDLPVEHGAPLRLRVERQIGYKHAKFVSRIEAVERVSSIGNGRGGFWEDRGYQWYAGL